MYKDWIGRCSLAIWLKCPELWKEASFMPCLDVGVESVLVVLVPNYMHGLQNLRCNFCNESLACALALTCCHAVCTHTYHTQSLANFSVALSALSAASAGSSSSSGSTQLSLAQLDGDLRECVILRGGLRARFLFDVNGDG
jgi:hypothetical protein